MSENRRWVLVGPAPTSKRLAIVDATTNSAGPLGSDRRHSRLRKDGSSGAPSVPRRTEPGSHTPLYRPHWTPSISPCWRACGRSVPKCGRSPHSRDPLPVGGELARGGHACDGAQGGG